MPALKNPKHEAYAQALAKGKSATDAYVSVGYKPSRSAASRLSANVNIERRIGELTNAAAEKTGIDIARTLKELGRVGMSDVRRLFDENGKLKPINEMDDDMAAAIASVEVISRPGETDVHKVRLWDKNAALDKIAKHLGMLVDRHEHGVSDPLAQMLADFKGTVFRPTEA